MQPLPSADRNPTFKHGGRKWLPHRLVALWLLFVGVTLWIHTQGKLTFLPSSTLAPIAAKGIQCLERSAWQEFRESARCGAYLSTTGNGLDVLSLLDLVQISGPSISGRSISLFYASLRPYIWRPLIALRHLQTSGTLRYWPLPYLVASFLSLRNVRFTSEPSLLGPGG